MKKIFRNSLYFSTNLLVLSGTFSLYPNGDNHVDIVTVSRMTALPPKPFDIFSSKEFTRKAVSPLDAQITEKLSPEAQHQIAATILQQPLQQEVLPLQSPSSPLITNLNIVPYPDISDNQTPQLSLINTINRTKTSFGYLYLSWLLNNPTAHIPTLEKRQGIIKEFIANPDLMEKSQTIITQNKENIGHAMYPYIQGSAVMEKAFVDTTVLYPSLIEKLSPRLLKALNTNKAALTLWNISKPGSCLCGAIVLLGKAKTGDISLLEMAPLTCFIAPSAVGFQMQFLNAHAYLHRQYTHLAQALEVVDRFSDLAKKHPHLQRIINETMQKPKPSEKFEQLCNYLRSSTFKKNPSKFFAAFDDTIITSQLFPEVKNEFAERVFACIAKLDAFLSIAQLYNESQTGSNKYSLARYKTTSIPSLHLKDFWNPAHTNPIPNSIILSGDEKKNQRLIAVSGSNGAGKSGIVINGAGRALLLAQTIGLFPARSGSLTPFNYVGILAKIQEDHAKYSHLTATLEAAHQVAKDLVALKPDQHGIVFTDELFVGAADFLIANKLAREFLEQYILPRKNVLSVHVIQSTDVEGPAGLEKSHPNLCKNYKVDARVTGEQIEFPHLLEKGTNTVPTAELLFKNRFKDLNQQLKQEPGVASPKSETIPQTAPAA